MKTVLSFFGILFLFLSCSSHKSNNLIIGTWRFKKNNILLNEQIVFNTDNTSLIQSIMEGVPRTEKSIKYKLSDDKKILTIEEYAGKIKKIEIIELTSNYMRLKNSTSNISELVKQ
jgi:hypothetical protein